MPKAIRKIIKKLDEIIELLELLIYLLTHRASTALIFKDSEGNRVMSVSIDTTQQVPVTASAVDASGAASTDLVLPVSWVSSDDTIATVTVDGTDSTQATVMSVAEGDATVTASAMNNEGAPITGTLDVTVTSVTPPNPSTGLEITAGTPTAKA